MSLLHLTAQNYHASEFEVIHHRSLSVNQRVLDYLLSLADEPPGTAGETRVQLAASKRVIAARLDMAPETLSRTLRKLSDDGLIVVDRRTVHIQNAAVSVASLTSDGSSASVHYPRLERGAEPPLVSIPERVNLCGRQRMLSQRMAAQWVMVARGLGSHDARIGLRKSREQFLRNMRKLEQLDWTIPQQALLGRLAAAWAHCADLFAQFNPDHSAANAVFEASEALLDAANALTTTLADDLQVTPAHLVNLAGRNRMLSARLLALVLFFDWGIRPSDVGTARHEAEIEFAANSDILRAAASDSPEALAQLQIARDRWCQFVALTRAPEGAPASEMLAVIRAGEELLRHADTTVKIVERMAMNSV